jgi:hypothetical protein
MNGVTYFWTSADDNGNTSNGTASTTCPSFGPPVASCPEGEFGTPPDCYAIAAPVVPRVSLPTGIAVDPTDTELVNALNLAYPGVAPPDWLLYPYVVS